MSMELPNALFVASFDVARGHRAEFDRWYTDVHVPDAMGIPGFVSIRRYITGGNFPNASGAARYLNIYELAGAEAFRAGWDTDHRRASSEDFNRWAHVLSNGNVGLYIAKEQLDHD